jgi:hypothetical protein
MRFMSFYLKITFIIFLSLPSFATEIEHDFNDQITKLLLPNWPFQAFLAIPRISEMKPVLSIEISREDVSVYKYNCVELYYLKLQKKFEPKATLNRKSLHELLCRAMKRAVLKTDKLLLAQYLEFSETIALQFDFFSGRVRVVEIPYPPLNPFENLQNVFLDENDGLNFGDIDFPQELEPEIGQVPL